MTAQPHHERELRLRYRGRCAGCGANLPAGTRARWNASTRSARCLACANETPADPAPDDPVPRGIQTEAGAGPPVPDLGVAGDSAQREYERREGRRRARVTSPVPLAVSTGAGAGVGALIATFAHVSGGLWVGFVLFFAAIGALKVLDTPQHIDAWRSGAAGERAVGAALDALRSDGVLTVHDRRVPGSRANIDHIAVSPSGVFVVDAKNVAGKVSVAGSGLRVAGRRRDEMVPGVLEQVDVVRRALADQHLPDGIVRGVLCFTRADLPWLRSAPRGVQLLYRKGLARLLRRPGPFGPNRSGTWRHSSHSACRGPESIPSTEQATTEESSENPRKTLNSAIRTHE